jgi:hypothetical protein
MSRTLKDMGLATRARRRCSVLERQKARRCGRRGLIDAMAASAETTTRGREEVMSRGRFAKEVPT